MSLADQISTLLSRLSSIENRLTSLRSIVGGGGVAAHHATHEAGGADVVNADTVDSKHAQAVAAADKIPVSDGSGKLDTWISDAAAATKGKVQLAGQLGGTAASPTVTGITETYGPTALAFGRIDDGKYLKRSGSTVVGDTPASSGGASIIEIQVFGG